MCSIVFCNRHSVVENVLCSVSSSIVFSVGDSVVCSVVVCVGDIVLEMVTSTL